MKDIFILGAGGQAKDVYFLITQINNTSIAPVFNFCGFIEISKNKELKIGQDVFPVINEDLFIQANYSEETCLAAGIGNPLVLKKIYNKFINKFSFPNLISPDARGHWSSIKIGVGNIITAGCVFTVDIKIGSLNIFNVSSTIGHDSNIGNCNVINPGSNISGGVEIKDNILIGTNATLLQYLKIGENAIVGASSLVTKDVAANTTVIGVPARKI